MLVDGRAYCVYFQHLSPVCRVLRLHCHIFLWIMFPSLPPATPPIPDFWIQLTHRETVKLPTILTAVLCLPLNFAYVVLTITWVNFLIWLSKYSVIVLVAVDNNSLWHCAHNLSQNSAHRTLQAPTPKPIQMALHCMVPRIAAICSLGYKRSKYLLLSPHICSTLNNSGKYMASQKAPRL